MTRGIGDTAIIEGYWTVNGTRSSAHGHRLGSCPLLSDKLLNVTIWHLRKKLL